VKRGWQHSRIPAFSRKPLMNAFLNSSFSIMFANVVMNLVVGTWGFD
jgi:hypothetical protein